MSFEADLKAVAAEIDGCIDAAIGRVSNVPLHDAMRHASVGGKKLRGFLVVHSAGLFDVQRTTSILAAAAIECVHAYSLVHDDLPAMDDDDLRRGRPTVHKKWDEATAILAGDALQSLAFQLLGELDTSPDRIVNLTKSLALAAGQSGMVLGQAQDIAAETAQRALTLDEIIDLQANKTGALIRWSAEAGARLGGADPEPLTRYATALGLAFQIADDILDVTGDEAKAGKKLQKDADAGKATFVSLLGLEEAKARARALVAEAEDALCTYDARADNLRAAARFVISREF